MHGMNKCFLILERVCLSDLGIDPSAQLLKARYVLNGSGSVITKMDQYQVQVKT